MKSPIRILHLEDDPVSTGVALKLLRRDGLDIEIDRVDTWDSFVSALKTRSHALILSDYTIPGMNTLDALHLAIETQPDVPYVFFSGTLGEEAAVEALKRGATDYILKDRVGRLAPAVRRALREGEDHALRRQAEHTSQLFAAIVSSSEDAILSKTLDGVITSWNKSAERLFGYTATEAIGQNITLIIPEDRLAEEQLILDRIKRGEGMEHYETVRRKKDGSILPVSLSVSPVRDHAGKIIGAAKIARDISQRLQTEEALRESEARLLLFLENSPVSLAIFDREMRYLAASHRWLQDYGLSGNLIGRHHYEVIPDLPEKYKAMHRRALAGEVLKSDADPFVRPDGSILWRRWEMLPWYTSFGEIGGIMIATEDITRRKEAEESLRQSEEKFRAVFEQAAVGIGRVSFADARWIDVNLAFCRMLGYTADELKATPWPKITHPDDVDLDLIPFRRMAEGQLENYTVEKRFIHKQGHPIWARLTLSLIRDAHGQPDYEVAIIEDISERKEAEALLHTAKEDLARANQELDRKVRERTTKLRETVGELEGLSYSLVHDLRAPLRAMQGYASLLEQDAGALLRPEDTDYLRRIKVAANRMDQLITDSFNYSKVLRDELPLRPVNVGKLLRGILETYPDLQPHKAEINLEIDDLIVQGNEAALTQVFSNLLGNAVKFVAPGVKPEVRVWAEKSSQTPSRMLIYVQDNGIGISKEAQGRIFGMFHRLHGANEYPGTGIGLAIVRKSLERIGGQVFVESQPGKGSRFCVELPLVAPNR